ncbi:MAG: CDP-diacylglycerol--serine O-phosphatidyltransferase [Bacteroidales bacterium]|nr:CDP-diacylglycerol--serine O-phosphatidyltransferase [Bacteroidales bacterium]
MIRNLTRHLPNFITAINLACGFTSIVLIIEGNMIFACYFILLATIFDFLDGFFARLFDAYSDIGKQLDSLADIVSFGVAPALIMYAFLRISILDNNGSFSFESLTFFEGLILFSPVLLAIASAFRLAKFNIDPSQHDSFYGLPTPANAIFISSFVMNVLNHQKLYDQGIFTSKYFLLVLTIILSCLLVSRIPMFALKFHNFSFSENKIRYVFIGISVILVIVLQLAALPFIIAIYILISLGCTIFKTRDKQIVK